jgi:hypothetical protein
VRASGTDGVVYAAAVAAAHGFVGVEGRLCHWVFTGYCETRFLPTGLVFAYQLLTWFDGVSTGNTDYLMGLFVVRHQNTWYLLVFRMRLAQKIPLFKLVNNIWK